MSTIETNLPKWTPGTGASPLDDAHNYSGPTPDGYAVLTRTRDSRILEQSNFDAALYRLRDAATKADAPSSVDIHRCSHWGCGWLETIVVAPDAPAPVIAEAEAIVEALASYPILDDDDCSQRETEACRELWEGADCRERMRMAERAHAKAPLRFARMKWSTLCRDHGDASELVRDHVHACATE